MSTGDLATFNSLICPIGTFSGPFSLSDPSQCRQCPAGYTCKPSTTNAITGIVSLFKVSVPELIMPMPIPCNPGFYKANTGAGDCTPCPAGRPCPYYGLTTYEIGVFCEPGHYCPLQTSYPN